MIFILYLNAICHELDCFHKEKDLEAPQERDKTDVQTEKIWGTLIRPVLNIITT